MKKVFILCLAFIMFYCNKNEEIINPTTYEWQWVKQIGAQKNALVNRLSTDGYGNVFISGKFKGTIIIEGNQFINKGDCDCFFAKFSPSGNLLWLKTGGGPLTDYGYGIVADPSGNCYASIMFQSTIDFENKKFTSEGEDDILLVKYNSDGILQWTKQIGGTGEDNYPDVTTDAFGNIYLFGEFSSTVVFDGIKSTSYGSTDIFITKYDPSGNIQWLQHAGGTDDDHVVNIKADYSGNTYIIGKFKGTTNFGSIQLSGSNGWDVFIAKLNPTGNFLWVKRSAGLGTEDGDGVSVDNNGNCYVTGCFYYSTHFDTANVSSMGYADIYIAKYNSSGIMQWFRRAGGYNEDLGYGISTDNLGNCYVIGMFKDYCDFGKTRLFSQGDYDIFITKLNSSGDFLWAERAGGRGVDQGVYIYIDKSEYCFVGGLFGPSATFGSKELSCSGSTDAFIGKFKH